MAGNGERADDGHVREPFIEMRRLPFDIGTLKVARALIVQYAIAAGMDEDRVQDVELVVSELTANSVEHGGGAGLLSYWRENGSLVIEVSDGGRISDLMLGSKSVAPSSIRGRGLMLVRMLADHVSIHRDLHGTIVRARFDSYAGVTRE